MIVTLRNAGQFRHLLFRMPPTSVPLGTLVFHGAGPKERESAKMKRSPAKGFFVMGELQLDSEIDGRVATENDGNKIG